MSKNRVLAILILLLPVVGCASFGMKKPKVPILYADDRNNIPADIPSQFLDRYYFLVTGREPGEFHKLITDKERKDFIAKFWTDRDTNPTTPENEYKQEKDQLIDNISAEIFFDEVDTLGLLFSTNGGFRGDMARVYLLHGDPNLTGILKGNTFVNLMLWIYLDENNGNIRYAFLFYKQTNSIGTFSLFPQDLYKMDSCGAINEISVFKDYSYVGVSNRACSPSMEGVVFELQNATSSGLLNGYYFVWALFNFSQNGSILQGEALRPPKPASEVAKSSIASVAGEAPKLTGMAGTDYILASCKYCNSLIPAQLHLGKELWLSIRQGDVDWQVSGSQVEVGLKTRVIMENTETRAVLVFEKQTTNKNSKDLIVSSASNQIAVVLVTADEVNQIPAGSYRVNVYVKNIMTKKYNAWLAEFKK